MRPIAQDVWQVSAEPLKLPLGVRMPIASTVIRLADRSLLVYSPVRFTDEQAAAIDAEGQVSHVVAPNLFHHLYLGAAAQRWPKAAVHGPPGLAAKRSDLKFDRELSGALDAAIDVEVIAGAPRINECVLFHRPSGTLVCADFVFNVTNPANLRTRVALAVMGVGGRELKQSRLWRMLAKERAALRASVDRILAWPIRTILPAHGDAASLDAGALAQRVTHSYGGKPAAALTA